MMVDGGRNAKVLNSLNALMNHRFSPAGCGIAASVFQLRALESGSQLWEIRAVKTLTVDASKRVRIPDAKPRQVFAYENHGNGSISLTLVKGRRKERFPPGSLKKYITAESDKEMLELLKGCSLEMPE